ncbi:MAG: redoxin domain-containing protein [Gammaproteobacteria bacterium]|nr:redoxin domain-containing protein [Gammaproteobacteria bacterium]
MNKACNLAQRIIVLLLFTGIWTSASAQDFDWAPDFPVGATIPVLEAPDQNGEVQTLDSLTGDKGILLVFSRSFDWCPFCKAQLDGLTTAASDFDGTGFSIVTITYDPVETLKLVEEDLDIGFTMLHDEAIKHVNAFNILNTGNEPGSFAYGVPQPGVMLVSADGEILAKFAEENFRVRPDWLDVVAAARNL